MHVEGHVIARVAIPRGQFEAALRQKLMDKGERPELLALGARDIHLEKVDVLERLAEGRQPSDRSGPGRYTSRGDWEWRT